MEIIMIIGIILVCIIVIILSCLDRMMEKVKKSMTIHSPSRTYDWIGNDMKKFRKKDIRK